MDLQSTVSLSNNEIIGLSPNTVGNKENKILYSLKDIVEKGDELFVNMKSNPVEIINMDKKKPLEYIEGEKYKTTELINIPMSRNRDLEFVKKYHPVFFKEFIEPKYKNHPGQSVFELGSGEGLLLTDLVKEYGVKAMGIDGNHPKGKQNYTKGKFDIRNFNLLPKNLPDVISLHTLQYVPNSIFGIEAIYNKMKPGTEAWLDLGPQGLYSQALRDYLYEHNYNSNNSIAILEDCIVNDGKDQYSNMIVYLNKGENETTINVPDKYIVIRGITQDTKDGSKIPATPYFCHYYLENDPELL